MVRLLNIIGVRPQCRPKITNTCQKVPTIIPAIIGEKSMTEVTPADIRLDRKVATGPKTMKPRTSEHSSVNIGTRKFATTSGTIFANHF